MNKSKRFRNRKKNFTKIIPVRIDESIEDIFKWIEVNDKEFVSNSHFIRTAIFTTYLLRKEYIESVDQPMDSDKMNWFLELFNDKESRIGHKSKLPKKK